MPRSKWCFLLVALALILGGVRAASADEYHQEFLKPWKVIGPIGLDEDNSEKSFDEVVAENEAAISGDAPVEIGGESYSWQDVGGPILDVNALFSENGEDVDYTAFYALARLTADEAREVTVAVGADDMHRVWLNGEIIGEHVGSSGLLLDQYLYSASLRAGENTLLLKAADKTGGAGAFVRILPADVESDTEPMLQFQYREFSGTGFAQAPTMKVTFDDGTEYFVDGFRKAWQERPVYSIYGETPDPLPAQVVIETVDAPEALAWSSSHPGAILSSPQIAVVGKEARLEAKLQLRFEEDAALPETVYVSVEGNESQSFLPNESSVVSLTGLGLMETHFEVVAAGYGKSSVTLPPNYYLSGSDAAIPVLMKQGGRTLTGIVKDTAGNPIEGALVSDSRGVSLASGTDGKYMLLGISEDNEKVYPVVSAPGFAPKGSFGIDLKGSVTKYDITLEAGGILTGRVTDSDGNPLQGIRIVQGDDRFPSNSPTPDTTTAKDGSYTLSGLPVGHQPVSAFSPDYAPAMVRVNLSPESPATHDFILEKGQPVEGRVVDSEGNPISGVRVTTDTWGGIRMFERNATTDRDGRFRLDNMPSDDVEIDMYTSNFTSLRDKTVRGGQTDLEFTMMGPASISGKVVDAESGEPVSEFALIRGLHFKSNPARVYWQNDERDRTQYMVNNPDGEFEFEFDELSNYDLEFRVEAPGYRPQLIEDVMLKMGDQVSGLVVKLEKGVALSGNVQDADGSPVAGADIYLYNADGNTFWLSNKYGNEPQGPRTTSGNDGRYELSSALPGEYGIYAAKKDVGAVLMDEAVTIGDDSQTVDITLMPHGAVEGYIILGGEPVRDGEAIVMSADMGQEKQISMFGETDDEGYFKVEGLPASEYRVGQNIAADNTSAYSRLKPVTVDAGVTAFVAIGGEGTGRVYGKVSDNKDQPITMLSVTLYDQAKGQQFSDVTGTDGTYSIPDLPVGSYSLRASRFDRNGPGLNYSSNVSLEEGEEVEHQIQIFPRLPLGPGVTLPEMSGKDKNGEEVTLSVAEGEEAVLVFPFGEDPEMVYRGWQSVSAGEESNVYMLVLETDPYAGFLKENPPGYRTLLISISTIQSLYTRIIPSQGDWPALIVDSNMTVKRTFPTPEELEAFLEENYEE